MSSYEFDFSFLQDYWSELVYGVWLTVGMTAVSIIPGFILGTACAVARLRGAPWLRRLATVYVEGIRNTPLIIQAFWLFFGLSVLQIRIGSFAAAVVALVINVGAYTAEIMRAGFRSIPRGQLEAASCLALTPTQSLVHTDPASGGARLPGARQSIRAHDARDLDHVAVSAGRIDRRRLHDPVLHFPRV